MKTGHMGLLWLRDPLDKRGRWTAGDRFTVLAIHYTARPQRAVLIDSLAATQHTFDTPEEAFKAAEAEVNSC